MNIWQHFFDFSEEVARILTSLTTYHNCLPQGASTSPGIANLVFYDKEPRLFTELEWLGFHYTRYLDDIYASTDDYVDIKGGELEPVFAAIYGMMGSKNLKPNRDKEEISTNDRTQRVHNLNVNAGVPTMLSADRARIRTAVKQCEQESTDKQAAKEYRDLWRSVRGRVARLYLLHPNEAEPYIQRLEAIKPLFDGD